MRTIRNAVGGALLLIAIVFAAVLPKNIRSTAVDREARIAVDIIFIAIFAGTGTLLLYQRGRKDAEQKIAFSPMAPLNSTANPIDSGAVLDSVTFDLTADDLKTFQIYGNKNNPTTWRARVMVGLMMVGCSLYVTFNSADQGLGSKILLFVIMLVFFAVVFTTFLFVLHRVLLWRAFASEKYKSLLCRHTVTLREEGLIAISPFGRLETNWGGILKIVDAPMHIYVFTSPLTAKIIPKRAFSNLESVKRFLDRANELHRRSGQVAMSTKL